MPSLNDLLGKLSLPSPTGLASSIGQQVTSQIKSTSQQIANIPGQLMGAATAQLKGGVSAATNAGLADVKGAVAQALTGNFSGALTTLSNSPADVMGAFGSAFGSNSGGGVGGGGGPVNTLQGALGRPDPMMSFLWYCDLPVVTPIGGAPTGLSWEYVEEATPGFRTYDARGVYSGGRQRHFVGAYNVESLRLNFYADVGNNSLKYLMSWDGAVMKPTTSSNATSQQGGFGRPSDYMKTIKIYLLDPTKMLVATLEYTECWPTNLEGLHLDSGSSTRLTYNVSFSTGDVFATLYGINQNLSGQALLSSLEGLAVNAIKGLF